MHGVQAWRRSDLALEASLPAVADVASVTPLAAAHGTEVIQVTPGTSPEAEATSDLIYRLRSSVIPDAERGSTLRVYVGGVTATFADFAAVVSAGMPWLILAIVGLSFLLLVVAFSGVLIPATAGVMNLLAGAAHVWGADRVLGGPGRSGPSCRW